MGSQYTSTARVIAARRRVSSSGTEREDVLMFGTSRAGTTQRER